MWQKVFVVALGVMLLAACSTATAGDGRFSNHESVFYMKDTKTGCEYVSKGGHSSWTYLHGSCPDIISQENGVVPKKSSNGLENHQ